MGTNRAPPWDDNKLGAASLCRRRSTVLETQTWPGCGAPATEMKGPFCRQPSRPGTPPPLPRLVRDLPEPLTHARPTAYGVGSRESVRACHRSASPKHDPRCIPLRSLADSLRMQHRAHTQAPHTRAPTCCGWSSCLKRHLRETWSPPFQKASMEMLRRSPLMGGLCALRAYPPSHHGPGYLGPLHMQRDLDGGCNV